MAALFRIPSVAYFTRAAFASFHLLQPLKLSVLLPPNHSTEAAPAW